MTVFRILTIFLVLVVLSALAGCGGDKVNNYMTRNSAEYLKSTKSFLGEKDVTSYVSEKKEKMALLYEEGKVVFSHQDGTPRGKVRFCFSLPQHLVDKHTADWRAKWNDTKIDKYDIIVEADWYIDKVKNKDRNKDEEIIYFEEAVLSAKLSGEGKYLSDIEELETEKLCAPDAVANAGYNEISPNLPSEAKIKIHSNSIKLKSQRGISFLIN